MREGVISQKLPSKERKLKDFSLSSALTTLLTVSFVLFHRCFCRYLLLDRTARCELTRVRHQLLRVFSSSPANLSTYYCWRTRFLFLTPPPLPTPTSTPPPFFGDDFRRASPKRHRNVQKNHHAALLNIEKKELTLFLHFIISRELCVCA